MLLKNQTLYDFQLLIQRQLEWLLFLILKVFAVGYLQRRRIYSLLPFSANVHEHQRAAPWPQQQQLIRLTMMRLQAPFLLNHKSWSDNLTRPLTFLEQSQLDMVCKRYTILDFQEYFF